MSCQIFLECNATRVSPVDSGHCAKGSALVSTRVTRPFPGDSAPHCNTNITISLKPTSGEALTAAGFWISLQLYSRSLQFEWFVKDTMSGRRRPTAFEVSFPEEVTSTQSVGNPREQHEIRESLQSATRPSRAAQIDDDMMERQHDATNSSKRKLSGIGALTTPVSS